MTVTQEAPATTVSPAKPIPRSVSVSAEPASSLDYARSDEHVSTWLIVAMFAATILVLGGGMILVAMRTMNYLPPYFWPPI
jgi:hypothetical protein